MSRNWPLVTLLPILTAAIVFVNALVVTGFGLSSHEAREGAIREDVTEAFLDTLAGVIAPNVGEAIDGDRVSRALNAAGRFKPALRNQGIVLCCDDDAVISGVSETDPTNAETLAPLAERVRLAAASGTMALTKDVFPEDGKFVIAKGYEAESGRRFHLAAAFELDHVYSSQTALWRQALIIDLAFSLLAATLVFFVVRIALRPIDLLTRSLMSSTATKRSEQPRDLLGPNTEIGRLQRVPNDRIAADQARDEMAELERTRAREAVLARLAASLAHELRNPLAGMGAAISTLRRFGDQAKVRADTADLLERGIASLDRVAAGMLSTYRPSSGERNVTPDDIGDLRVLVEPKLQRKSVALDFSSQVDTPFPASADPVRQIILNLLLNAGEAVPVGGHVRFSAEIVDDHLVFDVEDNGPGMPEEALAVVTQTTGETLPRQGRLGLWLIHKLLDDIDARISVNTRAGRGTTVKITVPPRGKETSHG